MTVRLRSDRHPLFGPGFALLMFDRPINTPRLDISILNTVTGLYLGPSAPGRPNWVKQQTTFFPAIRAGGQGSNIFRVGPEVTTYIQEGTYIEIANADGSVREELSWEGILLRSSPAGTEDWANRAEAFESGLDGSSVDADQSRTEALGKARRDEQEAIRQKQQEEDRLRAEQAAAASALAKQQAEEHARRAAEEAAVARLAQEEAIRRKQQDEERLRAEQAAEAAALAIQQAEDYARRQAGEVAAIRRANEARNALATNTASSEPSARSGDQAPPESVGQDSKRPRKRGILVLALIAAAIGGPILVFATVIAIGIGARQAYDPGYLCLHFDLFCSQGTETTTAPGQNFGKPQTEIGAAPAAEQPSNDDCTAKAMGTYSRPTNDRIQAYINAHEEKRDHPESDLDGIARRHCFADKDDYTRSYFAISAASASGDQSLSRDLLVEYDAEMARTIKPSDDPTLLPSNSQQPSTADSSGHTATGAPRRRR